MASKFGAVHATPGRTSFKQQRSSGKIVGTKKNQCSIKDNSFQYTIPHDDSFSGSSASSCEPVSDFPTSFRRKSTYIKKRRIKPAATSHVEGSGGVTAKGKRKPRQEEDEDYREFPQKKHKLYGRKQRPKIQPTPKPQTRRIRKEPPAYAAGSLEEQWYLEIMDKGSVSCPTCQSVGRKTIPILKTGGELDEPSERERLRTVLKRLGKIRCIRESCSSTFTSIMGYMYHVKKCGKEAAELEKMTLKCHHCEKPYRSKAGLAYHLRSEHGPISFSPKSGQPECLKDMSLESKSGGRVQRRSAKIAVYHLQELASAELAKEWPKRKVLQDLIPDDRKLKYTRPGLPTFSQEVLHKWKLEVKKYHRIQCPNQGCEAVYGSLSGLKAHLGSCTLGNFVVGKYKCLLCQKEFVSESGVKYHINSVHAEDWFIVNPTTTKSFEKLMKIKQQQQEEENRREQHRSRRSLRRQQQSGPERSESELSLRVDKDQRQSNEELVVSTSCKEPEQEPLPAHFQKVKSPKSTHTRGRKYRQAV
ncbi:PREDICTED: zinc finger protein 512 [Chrysochloris asiatica]|uniref:Zinc finger protein 512 n=1 Tax=Chrysochloris asiatica TaxID=185453 RepID=A0A9B0T4Q1_CHRAS|nr:PREDICTED: zinc finger protein 512 [Chrysochloris asiatica]